VDLQAPFPSLLIRTGGRWLGDHDSIHGTRIFLPSSRDHCWKLHLTVDSPNRSGAAKLFLGPIHPLTWCSFESLPFLLLLTCLV